MLSWLNEYKQPLSKVSGSWIFCQTQLSRQGWVRFDRGYQNYWLPTRVVVIHWMMSSRQLWIYLTYWLTLTQSISADKAALYRCIDNMICIPIDDSKLWSPKTFGFNNNFCHIIVFYGIPCQTFIRPFLPEKMRNISWKYNIS